MAIPLHYRPANDHRRQGVAYRSPVRKFTNDSTLRTPAFSSGDVDGFSPRQERVCCTTPSRAPVAAPPCPAWLRPQDSPGTCAPVCWPRSEFLPAVRGRLRRLVAGNPIPMAGGAFEARLIRTGITCANMSAAWDGNFSHELKKATAVTLAQWCLASGFVAVSSPARRSRIVASCIRRQQ